MRALQLVAPGQLEIRDVEVPSIGSDEVLVRVAGAGLCHSDLHVMHSPLRSGGPMTLGHETAGWVETVGAEVHSVATGDPVLVYLVWACGTCRQCQEGRDNVCATAAGRHGMAPCPGLGPDGGMAEYIKVPARYLEPLGDLDPVTAGPLADAALTSYHAIAGAQHRLGTGSTAVVIGIGGLGHAAVQILRATTPTTIVAIDVQEEKLASAKRLGATHTFVSDAKAADAVLDLTKGYGADAVFDFVATQATVDLAVGTIAPDGALRLVGIGGGALEFGGLPNRTGLPWGVDVRRCYAGTRGDQRGVLELARAGTLSIETHLYDLEDGLTAFADLEAGRVSGRAILVP